MKCENIARMKRTIANIKTLQRVPKGQRHPYMDFENTPLWRAVDRAVTDLIGNQDMAEDEYHEYIVGYICKVIRRRRNAIIAQLSANSGS